MVYDKKLKNLPENKLLKKLKSRKIQQIYQVNRNDMIKFKRIKF